MLNAFDIYGNSRSVWYMGTCWIYKRSQGYFPKATIMLDKVATECLSYHPQHNPWTVVNFVLDQWGIYCYRWICFQFISCSFIARVGRLFIANNVTDVFSPFSLSNYLWRDSDFYYFGIVHWTLDVNIWQAISRLKYSLWIASSAICSILFLVCD